MRHNIAIPPAAPAPVPVVAEEDPTDCEEQVEEQNEEPSMKRAHVNH